MSQKEPLKTFECLNFLSITFGICSTAFLYLMLLGPLCIVTMAHFLLGKTEVFLFSKLDMDAYYRSLYFKLCVRYRSWNPMLIYIYR